MLTSGTEDAGNRIEDTIHEPGEALRRDILQGDKVI